jgi:molecular chaperone GrpE
MNDRTHAAPGRTNGHADGPDAQPSGATKRKTRAEERIEALGKVAPPPPAEAVDWRARAEAAEQELAETKSAWQRTAADFANYRRRTDLQRADELGLASEALIRKVLALADDFDRAVDHVPPDQAHSPWVEGIVAIDRKLRGLLDSEGVTPIEAEGKPFDPREHEAVLHEPTAEAADGTVLRELQRGYYLRDRVLRPALVSVARNDRTTNENGAPAASQDDAPAASQDRE